MSRDPSRVTIGGGEGMPAQEGLVRRAGNAISDLVAIMFTAALERGLNTGSWCCDAASGQDAPSESAAPSALDGPSAGEKRGTPSAVEMVARRNVGMAPRPTPDETGSRGSTTPVRARMRTDPSLVAVKVVIAGQLLAQVRPGRERSFVSIARREGSAGC